MIKDIVTLTKSSLGDRGLLGSETKVVTDFDGTLRSLARDLIDTMDAHDICVGLAAPQIGHNVCVAVIRKDMAGDDEHLVIVNPKMASTGGRLVSKNESCMSLPGWCGSVEMRDELELKFFDLDGLPQVRSFKGFSARVARHETDHLAGTMYVDHVKGGGSELETTDIFD